MENRAGSGGRAGEDIPRRLNGRVAGPAMAAGAVSLGLVLIGSCGLGQHDVYVSPPPLNADLQSAPTGGGHSTSRSSGTTAPAVFIPPSPTWRVAINPPAPRRTISGFPSASPTSGPVPHPAPGEVTHGTDTEESEQPASTTVRTTTTRPTTRPAPTTRQEPTSNDEDH